MSFDSSFARCEQCGESDCECDDCPLLKLAENQEDLPEEFSKVLHENLEDLYATNNNDYVDVKTEGGTTRLVLLANK